MSFQSRLRRLFGRILQRLSGAGHASRPKEVLGARLHEDGQPAGLIFKDIVVMPGMPISNDINNIDGGPLWPDFERQTWVRHMRGAKPVDFRPPPPDGPVDPKNGFHVWGGMLFPHFGHLIADLTTRLLWSLHRWPDAPFLFVTRPEQPAEKFPTYVWDILDWLGMPRSKVGVVDRPLCVERLGVMPQAERVRIQMDTWPGYLELLEERQRIMNLTPRVSKYLYVGRTGLFTVGAGAHAGESHLVDRLRALGIECLDPTTVPLRTQLEHYAGAKTLIFAEGSAIHGRQLLGRIDQEIYILNRRPGNKRILAQLRARAAKTFCIEASRVMARSFGRDERPKDHLGISFYDLDILFNTFAALGIDLRSVWNAELYERAKRDDIRSWLSHLEPFPTSFDLERSRNSINDILVAEGAKDLLLLYAPTLAGVSLTEPSERTQ